MKSPVKILALGIACGMLFAAVAKADFYIRDSDTVVLRSYVAEPTERVTFYTRGTVLPETVTYTALPRAITTRLEPAPAGAMYVSYGGNVYLIDEATRQVIDAVELY